MSNSSDKHAVDFRSAEKLHEIAHVCVMSMEVHVGTRQGLSPDPKSNPICALFYSISKDACRNGRVSVGCLLFVSTDDFFPNMKLRTFGCLGWNLTDVDVFATEIALIDRFTEIVSRIDPDILVGYDVQRHSWGYLLERGQTLGMDLCSRLSRVPKNRESRFDTSDHWWSLGELHLPGRIVLNLWRILRHEMALNSYTFCSVAFHLLRRRVPEYSFDQLTQWFDSEDAKLRRRVIDYYRLRVETQLTILDRCDLINRTSEMARLYGIQFYDVLSRGSQFRVESMLLRMTRKEGYFAPSPSPAQRNRMPSPECIALTMEPVSKFYAHPVLVLDFQSLYPSMCIAYNYCYSTCLGKLKNMRSDSPVMDFGCLGYDIDPRMLRRIVKSGEYHVSPAGVAFVSKKIRSGIIPRMLAEILDTRIMIKQRMKDYRDKGLLRVLDARQLALKLIANVTYGYTAANFSGRMPCVEIADSIVHMGRQTLENALKTVRTNDRWKARVIYGDTDSLFILLEDRSLAEAFQIGQEMATVITEQNPSPVKLKFEKVFYPCILEAKKRYVGYAYENVDQKLPKFDAKGIETVRRDTCPIVSKMLDRSLRLLFDNFGDLGPVERYVTEELWRILRGRVSLMDFVFAKEYRGAQSYKDTASVPALKIARQRKSRDWRSEPRNKERVPYVITAGAPLSTLLSCVRDPEEFLADSSLKINYSYYILRHIVPTLNRALTMIGFDVMRCYSRLPRLARRRCRTQTSISANLSPGKQLSLSKFVDSTTCTVCGRSMTGQMLLLNKGLCEICEEDGQRTLVTLEHKLAAQERRLRAVQLTCLQCTQTEQIETIACTSLDCPVYFLRSQLQTAVGKRHFQDTRDMIELTFGETDNW